MSVGALRRAAVPLAVALPIALVGLVAADGTLPLPFQDDRDTVSAVPTSRGLGILAGPDDPRLPDSSDLTGAHPATQPIGTSVVRQASARKPAPEPDTSDLALPARVLQAYRTAARDLRRSDSACHLDWPLLAGIGKVESGHAYGGEVDRRGDTLVPILGPVLDGGPGVAAIPDTDDGRWDTDETWDRAVGPMQFIPSSWSIHGADANDDGKRDPNNVNDASLASGGYLCSGDRDVSVRKQRRAAVYSYNHSWDYVDLVLAWADAYAGGTPVLTGTLAAMAGDGPRGGEGGGDGGSSAGTGRSDGDGGEVAALPPPSTAPAEPVGSASSPAPEASPAQSADPTGEPQPTATAEPTREPTPSTTPPPEGCPSPTTTPTTPDPSESPTPTDSPSQTPTAEPTPTPTDPGSSGSPSPTATPTPTCP